MHFLSKTPELYQDVDDAEYERQLLKAQTFVEDDGTSDFHFGLVDIFGGFREPIESLPLIIHRWRVRLQ